MVWTRLDRPRFGLANSISEMIAAMEWREPDSIADVRDSRELLIACDFGGSHKGAKYEAFAFLVGAITGSAAWMKERQRVRQSFLSDGRRMAYKNLNDKKRQQALLPFLEAANMYPGNLFVFLISKEIHQLFDNPGDQKLFPELIEAIQTWRPKPFRRLLLTATLGSILVSCLSSPLQDILWLTDQDEIAPNPNQHDHAGHVIHHCISTYAPANSGVLAFLTTEANIDNCMTEDVVAIPDLAAGSLVDALSYNSNLLSTGLWLPADDDLPPKSKLILWWLADRQQRLRRCVVVADRAPDANVSILAFIPLRGDNGRIFLRR
jgi:hypothetical protein